MAGGNVSATQRTSRGESDISGVGPRFGAQPYVGVTAHVGVTRRTDRHSGGDEFRELRGASQTIASVGIYYFSFQ